MASYPGGARSTEGISMCPKGCMHPISIQVLEYLNTILQSIMVSRSQKVTLMVIMVLRSQKVTLMAPFQASLKGPNLDTMNTCLKTFSAGSLNMRSPVSSLKFTDCHGTWPGGLTSCPRGHITLPCDQGPQPTGCNTGSQPTCHKRFTMHQSNFSFPISLSSEVSSCGASFAICIMLQ